MIAAGEAVNRLIHPQHLHYLVPLAAAGAIGFVGNELAARVRLRAGKRLDSPALIADGHHARVDGFVSLGVIASAIVVGFGAKIADPLIGLGITALILRITWQAWPWGWNFIWPKPFAALAVIEPVLVAGFGFERS